MTLRRAGAALWLALLTGMNTAEAQGPERWHFRQILVENDLFTRPFYEDSDRFYTSGMRASFGKGIHYPDSDPARLPIWLRPIRKRCGNCEILPNFAIGHEIYTPEDIEIAEPQPGERPWAAWLYAGLGGAIDTSERTRHEIDLRIGVTGDAAGGEAGQKFWHKVTGSPDPLGWDNQFGPDVGLNAHYRWQHIWKRSSAGSDIEWDFVPSVTAAVGTIMTNVGAGGTYRVGRNISDFPYTPLRTSRGPPRVNLLQDLEIYGFVGLNVRAVAYNYFLEGSLLDEEPVVVVPERYVTDLSLGVTARFRSMLITYTAVRRSEEFVRRIGDDRGIHVFGGLSLTARTR